MTSSFGRRYGAGARQPVPYAFDATSLQLLWRSVPGELHTSGKYNEPAVVEASCWSERTGSRPMG